MVLLGDPRYSGLCTMLTGDRQMDRHTMTANNVLA